MKKFLSVSGHGIAAAGVSLLGLALSPAVLGILPPKYALAVTALGVVYQASTGKALTTVAQPATPAPETEAAK